MRVYELAKEFGVQGKDLAVDLQQLGFDVKNHMTKLGDADVARVRSVYGGQIAARRAAEEALLRKAEAVAKAEAEAQARDRARREAEAAIRARDLAEAPPAAVSAVTETIEDAPAEPETVAVEAPAPAPPEAPPPPEPPTVTEEERAQAEAAEKAATAARERAEMMARIEVEMRARAEAKARVAAKAQAELDAKAKAQADAEAKIKAAEDAKNRAAAEAQARAESSKTVSQGFVKDLRNRVREESKHAAPPESVPADGVERVLHLSGPVTVREMAAKLGVPPSRLVRELMAMNVLASINERLDMKAVITLATKHGFRIDREKKAAAQAMPRVTLSDGEVEEEDRPEDLVTRPPVVTFLGHVDHGKTSLLDRIRNATVAAGEAGGITQHIGAYTVTTPDGRAITFLDTPGHEAFSAMRARGANMTDIAVIIIAADDGIMPQTREAIQHAQEAKVAVMVAINKMDLPGAKLDRVLRQLQEIGLSPETWGGTVVCCPVSAATGEGVPYLLEMIQLQSEVLELKANPKRRARGYVIEARLEQGMGPTASVLVTGGTLRVGDICFCSPYYGRIKALVNDRGEKVAEAGPSSAVQCLGLNGVPEPGTEMRVFKSEKLARIQAADAEENQKKGRLMGPRRSATITDLFAQLDAEEKPILKVILKADVQGSIEAIANALGQIRSDKIALDIVLTGTGNVSPSDVNLAGASNALILAFNVGIDTGVNRLAKHHGVVIQMHSIIYELLDEVQRAMVGMLAPMVQETVVGTAEVKQVFSISRTGRVAGSIVTKGYIGTGYRARVLREGDPVFTGSLQSLRRFQADVTEVREGQECGIRLDNFLDFQAGDTIEFFQVKQIAQTL